MNQGEVWIAKVPYSDVSDSIDSIANALIHSNKKKSKKRYVLVLGDVRPVLIISRDEYHKASSNSSVIACPITSNLQRAIKMYHTLKSAGFRGVTPDLLRITGNERIQAGLDRDSAIVILKVTTLNVNQLENKIGGLTDTKVSGVVEIVKEFF